MYGEWPRYIRKNESEAALRYIYFDLADVADFHTPEVGEAGGQPQISIDGAAYADAGIGVLVAVTAAAGAYYAEVTQAACNVNYAEIRGRFKSAATAEARGRNVIIVGGDIQDAMARLTNTTEVTLANGDLSVKEADGSTEKFQITDEGVTAGVHKMQRA